MLTGAFEIARPLLFTLGPEPAHEITLRSLEAGLFARQRAPDPSSLGQSIWGLDFPNPLGIAAGFDKNARVPGAIHALGFGFAEVGTVTPEAQTGNPRPRVFRLIDERAVVNRLGFNNAGHRAVLRRLEGMAARERVIGVNIGANKSSADRTRDYVLGVERFIGVADYFMINISSPNTPGLRDLQAPAALGGLLERVMATRRELVADGTPWRPIVVKLAPDIVDEDIPAIVDVINRHGVDGICVSNTTLSRDALRPGTTREAGGLSGRPLFERSTRLLARIYLETEGRVPLIGVGGIESGETALQKIAAGASLLQLYTGLVYEGPGLIARIKETLASTLEKRGLGDLGALIGTGARQWAFDRAPIPTD